MLESDQYPFVQAQAAASLWLIQDQRLRLDLVPTDGAQYTPGLTWTGPVSILLK